eukprot:NODE_1524_length_919_cov_79.944828_g1183_i0.p1 GENE.NODE_1524_length_919_cov_79.944828_g1183_i0~~NODE_1524_length_919_cov_79.944828_g1183_i0.p1  ORF type:complete len:268 (-),score=45.81 NODE_1524_length_919_cov_79.944828_g1183_i0:48-851(-)
MAFILLLLCLVACNAQDPTGSLTGVVDLTTANWDENMAKDSHFLIEFYAPWCGWCKKLVPVWTELGLLSENHPSVNVAKFDATQADSSEIKSKFGIRGFPTIILLKAGARDTPIKFTGDRTTEGFSAFVKSHTDASLDEHAPAAEAEKPIEADTASEDGTVIDLTPDNFDAVVLDDSKDVFVKFYAPWCGHCQRMEGAWNELAKAEPEVVIARCDASKYNELGSRFGVRGFPTLKWFAKSNKAGDDSYRGARDMPSLQSYVMDQKSK